MKNLFKLSLGGIAVLLFAVGCSREQTLSCTLHTNDVINGYELNSTYEVKATGGAAKVTKTTEEVTSDSEEILDYFETTLNTSYESADKAYGGYTYSINRNGNKITATVTIDYDKMNIGQFINDQPSMKSYKTIEGLKSIYESMGATCELK